MKTWPGPPYVSHPLPRRHAVTAHNAYYYTHTVVHSYFIILHASCFDNMFFIIKQRAQGAGAGAPAGGSLTRNLSRQLGEDDPRAAQL